MVCQNQYIYPPRNILAAQPIFAMSSFSLISLLTLVLFCCICLIQAQQPYVGLKTADCTNPDTSDSVLGYTCNGLNRSCQSYLVFRSQSPFNNVTSISNLLSSDPSQIAEINEVSETASFETNQLVIVPVNCSCSGDHYQVNTTYAIQRGDSGYLSVANSTFQALSTCQAIQFQQPGIPSESLQIGMRITVPLRCACPTKNQTDVGISYLLSYPIAQGDTVPGISAMFGADTERTLEANQLPDPAIFFFTTLLVPLQEPPSKVTVPPPPPASPPPPPPPVISPPNGSSDKTWVYILAGVLGGGAFILVVCTVVFCVFFRKSKKKPVLIVTAESFEANEKQLKKKLEDESQDFLDSMSSIAQSLNLKRYKFEELQLATDNFSPSCQIKGSVYQGVIEGDFAAIKKVDGDVSKEIELLNRVNHSNLIRLSGVSFNDGHWYLVYEYAANGALSDWIFIKDNSGKYLSWKQRIQIALDVATGLNYLHSFTDPPHIHKDLKSSNVLLDDDFRAKVANFALARSAEGREGQFALTRHIVGTKGYMAPEYLENGLVSTKLDVYAFGVLLLEVMTGKEAAAFYGEEHMNLSDILSNVLHEKDEQEVLKHLIDPSNLENYPSELAIVVFKLINSCLKKNPTARPAMDEIVQSLSRILTTSLTWDSSSNMSWSQTSTGSY